MLIHVYSVFVSAVIVLFCEILLIIVFEFLKIMHYFLVDDSIEIREVHEPNDGHDPFPVLLRRQKLPKDRNAVKGHTIN